MSSTSPRAFEAVSRENTLESSTGSAHRRSSSPGHGLVRSVSPLVPTYSPGRNRSSGGRSARSEPNPARVRFGSRENSGGGRRYSRDRLPTLRSGPRIANRYQNLQQNLMKIQGDVIAACVGVSINLLAMGKMIVEEGRFRFATDYWAIDKEVSRISFCGKPIFCTRFGCFVAWGLKERELEAWFEFLNPYVTKPLGPDTEYEDLSCVRVGEDVDEEDLGMGEGRVAISSNKETERWEMLAHSYALCQDVKLAVFETQIDNSIENTKHLPEDLASKGHIGLSGKQISKQLGKLFVQRFRVNLQSDILDTPDVIYQEKVMKPWYAASREYLELDQRVDNVNRRLEIIKDLYEVLQDEYHAQSETKLELIIIYLIIVEIMVGLLPYWSGFFKWFFSFLPGFGLPSGQNMFLDF